MKIYQEGIRNYSPLKSASLPRVDKLTVEGGLKRNSGPKKNPTWVFALVPSWYPRCASANGIYYYPTLLGSFAFAPWRVHGAP